MHYFQSIHNSDIFEVRGVQIENIENRMVSQNSVNETQNFNLSCAVALYFLGNSKWKQINWRVIVQNMLEYISQAHENHSNNPIKLIVHLLISFGSDFLFSFGI